MPGAGQQQSSATLRKQELEAAAISPTFGMPCPSSLGKAAGEFPEPPSIQSLLPNPAALGHPATQAHREGHGQMFGMPGRPTCCKTRNPFRKLYIQVTGNPAPAMVLDYREGSPEQMGC